MRDLVKVSWFDRALARVSPAAATKRLIQKQAWHNFSYDAVRSTTARNPAPQNINPNDFQKQRDRLQLMREAEDIENNFAPAKTINRKYAMYVAPISYHAQTGDPKLDKDVEDWLNHEWFPNCDITERYNFFKMLEFGVIGKNRGGDYGWAFMRPGLEDVPDDGKGNIPDEEVLKFPFRIQAVEPDRIGGIYQNVVSENYVAGVIVGKYGQPTHYRVFRRAMVVGQYYDPVDVPSNQFVHYTDPMRADMYRGVSMLDAGAANLRDLYELTEYIKAKAKLAGALTVFTNSNGAVQGTGAYDPYATSNVPNNQAALQQDIALGQINHLQSGQDIKFPENVSPGAETQYLINLCLKMVAWSYNLPYSFAVDAGDLGGVSSRLESEQAKAEFERGRTVIEPHAHRIKNAALIDATAKGLFPARYAERICKGRFGYRTHPQPDLGKEASAYAQLFDRGLVDPINYWIENQGDPETVAKNMARWYVIKKKVSEEIGANMEDVFGAGPVMEGASAAKAQADIPDAGKANEKRQLKKKQLELSLNDSRKLASNFKPKGKGGSPKTRIKGALISALHEVLPIDQAVAAGLHIIENGKVNISRIPEKQKKKYMPDPKAVGKVNAKGKEKGIVKKADKKAPDGKSAMSDLISKLIHEKGYTHKRAVAAAQQIIKSGKYDPKKKINLTV